MPRGAILDRNNQPIDVTRGTSGSLERFYGYPLLAPVTGYTHRIYGQAGLKSSLDPYLRGIQGNPSSVILWDYLLYGTPPPGLNVRLSIDLRLQKESDDLLGDLKGAVVLLNAQTGEVLSMSSHPTYDPNKLDQIGALLPKDEHALLLNRAAQGLYPLGTAGPAFSAASGHPDQPTEADLVELYQKLGLYSTPELRMPVASAMNSSGIQSLRVSPLQMAIAASTLSNKGVRPVARIALAVDTPQQGWVILPAVGQTHQAIAPELADQTASQYAAHNGTYWQWTGLARAGNETDTWFLAGTLPNWKATPLGLAVLVEGNYPLSAQRIGQQLIQSAMSP